MNHKRFFAHGIMLVLVVLLTACATPTATTAPTATNKPTATSLPTATPQPTATLPPTTTSLPTATPQPTVTPADLSTELDKMFVRMTQEHVFLGSVLIARQGTVLISQGYGLSDRKQNKPNTPQTRFSIASLTKQFTAMAILILESQGKLNVNDLIYKYIDNCPSTWGAITIEQLLTHTSGIPDFVNLPDFPTTMATPSAPKQIIARFKDLPLDFQPGEKWSYSNSGYVLLGAIIEKVSGQPYEAFLQQSIFTPLNMKNTGYDHSPNTMAVGYNDNYPKDTSPAPYMDMSTVYAAGEIYSTIEDLYRWDTALSTEQLVPRAYLDQMFAPHVAIPDAQFTSFMNNSTSYSGYSYGYGWFVGGKLHGHPVNFHYGLIWGFSSINAQIPDNQITIIVLSNSDNVDPVEILDVLSQKILGG
jgi:CubicO group peptidase (beta-lactamase class C family)